MGDIEHIDLNQVRRELWSKSHYFDSDTARTKRAVNSGGAL